MRELGRADDLDVGVEAVERGSQPDPGPRAGFQDAAVGAERLDRAVGGERPHLGGRAVEDGPAGAGPAVGLIGALEPRGHELGDVAGGELARREARAGVGPRGHAVGAEDPPVVAVEVPRDQVPAALGGDEVVRLHRAQRRVLAGVARVVEAQHLAGAGRGRHRDQHVGRHRRRVGKGGERQRVEPVPQARRHDLPDGGERPEGRFRDARPRGGGGLECDRQCDDLLVVEQQRRELAARLQPVAAVRPQRGADAVAHRAQPVDVATDGAVGDLQPLGEHGARPLAPGLQQGQQREET
ncbi:hypothetical protein OJ962_22700 [Solirubrobacter sp. CPCC 204708]|uniref:Uncharacterized protein n=1 Tax=Solirubrobacter deserti TaxID=2282478 RepID=A0ABT4RP83_9ACTN|nr:hypothetical protein [Solirubrobacter deserti]MDA0140326.1 hypothetical protein [Solirubrobacter deserti]